MSSKKCLLLEERNRLLETELAQCRQQWKQQEVMLAAVMVELNDCRVQMCNLKVQLDEHQHITEGDI